MRKQSGLNVLLFLLSIAGAAASFAFGEVLLTFVAYLPFWVQCGIYLLFVMTVCCLVMVISEKIHTGNYLLKHRREFGLTAGKAALIFLPAAVVLGIITQLLFGITGTSVIFNRNNFQGTMLVCDISGSMIENDPDYNAIEAAISYIDDQKTVKQGEYLGVILFNHDMYSIREYAPLKDEAEREELKKMLQDNVYYGGGTNIDLALLSAISEMRTIENPKWPGLILFFSDGGRGDCTIDYDRIREASLGKTGKPEECIPVNTIYYSSSPMNGSHMILLAESTGGEYIHVGFDDDVSVLRNVFTQSRTSFKWGSNQHLIKYNIGPDSKTAIKVILRALFLTLWSVLAGVFIVLFMNNNNLIKHFLIPRIIVSVICGVAFSLIMLNFDSSIGGTLARALLSVGICVMYLPTYRWD